MFELNAVLRSTAPISSAIDTNKLRKISRSTALLFARFTCGRTSSPGFRCSGNRGRRLRRLWLLQFVRLSGTLRTSITKRREGHPLRPIALLHRIGLAISPQAAPASPDFPSKPAQTEASAVDRSCRANSSSIRPFRFHTKDTGPAAEALPASTINSPCCAESNQNRWMAPAVPPHQPRPGATKTRHHS